MEICADVRGLKENLGGIAVQGIDRGAGLQERGRRVSVAWFVPVRHTNFDRMPASVWIRCLQLLPYLERRGIQSSVNNRQAGADVCVLVRMQDEVAEGIARSAKQRGCKVAFDLCVNYFDETGILGDGYGVTRKHVEECLRMVALADVVVVASRYIEARARNFHSRVVYLPDSVDRLHFSLDKTYEEVPGWGSRNAPAAIWCGYSVKARELEPFFPLLAEREIPLTIVSDRKPSLSFRFQFVRWRYASAPHDLLRGDFCIAPRQLDTPYNLGHSVFKIGMFLAEGVPALASPVPSYREVLIHERTGLLCDSLGDWGEALERVRANRDVLRGWSHEAREVMRPYLTEQVAEQYAELFREVAQ